MTSARCVLALAGALLSTSIHAAPPLDEQLAASLVTAVTAANAMDLYHSRCRRDDAGRYSDNLNKLLVSRYQLTIVGVQDQLFPERDYRAAQRRLEQVFAQQLRDMGGCAAAKQQGLLTQLRQRLETALAALAQ